ncbi:MAG: hypothetical protein MK078_13485 [Crocinitomicaceae bacterium]|nr:hypothetical protein [Crocinitomicaceae bacterium]
MRLRNTSGADIDFLLVEFDWFQFSIAEDDGNFNTIDFSYKQAATITTVTGGGWTDFDALDFTMTTSGGCAGVCSSQISGSCTITGSNSACINVNIPAGEEIMLRWSDPNDAANDPHMGIDNVGIGIGTDVTCAFILPIKLLNFTAEKKERSDLLKWQTASEANSSHFEVEASSDGEIFYSLDIVAAAANSSTVIYYSFENYFEVIHPVNYYRLKKVDLDGNFEYTNIISVNRVTENIYYANELIHLNNFSDFEQTTLVRLYNMEGKTVYEDLHSKNDIIAWKSKGIYILELPEYGINKKIVAH